jgi:hypothetical protein
MERTSPCGQSFMLHFGDSGAASRPAPVRDGHTPCASSYAVAHHDAGAAERPPEHQSRARMSPMADATASGRGAQPASAAARSHRCLCREVLPKPRVVARRAQPTDVARPVRPVPECEDGERSGDHAEHAQPE